MVLDARDRIEDLRLSDKTAVAAFFDKVPEAFFPIKMRPGFFMFPGMSLGADF